MKPGFALNLTHEGIGLLHRASGGWRLVDEVRLDDPELATKLAVMRKTAASLDPGGLTTKLVIPNSQILYRTVTAPGPGDGQRHDQIRAALDGATPYAVDDLVFDWDASGDQAHVAAVAKETLDEAEDFATEYKFNPVSFVAIPDPGGFRGEPFFGMARAAETVLDGAEVVERDAQAIVLLGKSTPTTQAPTDSAAPVPTPPPDPAAAAGPAPSFSSTFQSRPASDLPAEPPVTANAPSRISFVPVGDPTEAPLADAEDDAQPGRAADAIAALRADPAPTPAPETPKPVANGRIEPRISAPVVPPPLTNGIDTKPPEVGTFQPIHTNGAAPQGSAATAVDLPEDLGGAPAVDRDVLDDDEARQFAEEQSMTVFGARKSAPIGGKPKYLGLVLTVILLLFLAAVAVWSSFFISGGVTGLFPQSDSEFAESEAAADEANLELAAVEPTAPLPPLTDPTLEPELPEPAEPPVLSEDEARAYHAATGVWQLPPANPVAPQEGSVDDLYIASIDPRTSSHDAVALPQVNPGDDLPLGPQRSALPQGSVATLDGDGRVVPTPEGTLSQDGILIYAGRPDIVPPVRPGNDPEPDLSAGIEEALRSALADIRPRPRPGGLVESTERVRFGGRTLAELGTLRPKARPAAPQQEEEVDQTPTVFAVARSQSPKARPGNIGQLVAAARARAPQSDAATQSAAASTAAVSPRQSVTPAIPTRASVARRATVPNAINLRRVSLIGVYGTSSQRRALVRLPSGRYVKVSVGDRIDGGKVAAIGQSELRYVKGGRNVTLKMPSS